MSYREFIVTKPCDRCPITLVDPVTGIVRGKEPLHTLNLYKRWKNFNGKVKPIFGENMLPLGEGPIHVGDEMIIKNLRSPPLRYGENI